MQFRTTVAKPERRGKSYRKKPFALRTYKLLAMLFFIIAVLLMCAAVARADPGLWRIEGWDQTDFSRTSIDWREITSGGPPKDGIPSIDKPRFIRATEKRVTIADREAVIGLSINGDARAYPVQILMWHEIVNDTVGGVPVTITYCPLCNAAIVFNRATKSGTLTFGTTGKLRKSDMVMYDRQTQSWWQQFSGNAIVGTLTGQQLKIIPSRLESFSLFKSANPDGRVLVPNDKDFRAYGRNPYSGYDTSKVPFLYRGESPSGINPMARVVSVRGARGATAVTLELLRSKKHITMSGIELTWRKGQASALDHETVAGGRDVGNVVARRVTPSGKVEDVAYDITFAFVFHAFNPDTSIIKSCDGAVRSAGANGHQSSFECGPPA